MSEQSTRQRRFLDALGIDLYVRRELPPELLVQQQESALRDGPAEEPLELPWETTPAEPAAVKAAPSRPAASAAPPPQPAPTQAIEPPQVAFDDLNPPPLDEVPGFYEDPEDFDFADLPSTASIPTLPPVASLDWEGLETRVKGCEACPELAANRTQTVFGVGNRQADWLIIGEAPGADEDAQGEPFVGKAGQLLNRMLRAIGLKREQVYIANVLKCRPPNNRDPHADEAQRCEPYLQRQITLIQPKVILIVGRIAAQSLLQSKEPVGKLRGLQRYGDTPVVVTYHPAYLLRSPTEKRKSWDDLRLALRVSRGEVGG